MKKVTYILPFIIVLSFVLSGCSKDTTNETEQAVVQEKNPDENNGIMGTSEAEVVNLSESTTADSSSNSSDATSGVVTTSIVSSNETQASDTTVAYKDGVYKKRGVYESPAGPESIQVNVTLASGKINDLVVVGDATHEVSKKFQTLFAEGISKLVIGKPIDQVESYSQVSGSSLTPKGFDEALKVIKEEAAK